MSVAACAVDDRLNYLEQAPEPIRRYFALDTAQDNDALVSLFSADATVIDESKTHTGTAEIRAWRCGAASDYEYTTTITDIRTLGADSVEATGRLDGNFPGGTATLTFAFGLTGDHIRRLQIRSVTTVGET